MEAEKIQAALNAVLLSTKGASGMTAESVNDLATALQNVTMFEDDAIVEGENMLLTFTGIGKDVFPDATEAMLDMSQALGQDMKGSAIQLGKALNDPIAGATALRKVGVALTDAQEEQIKAFVASGDVMSAQESHPQRIENRVRRCGQGGRSNDGRADDNPAKQNWRRQGFDRGGAVADADETGDDAQRRVSQAGSAGGNR